MALLTPPSLTVPASISVDKDVKITFTDSSSWHSNFLNVTINNSPVNYTITHSGNSYTLSISPANNPFLRIPDNYTLVITESGYQDATCSFKMTVGKPFQLQLLNPSINLATNPGQFDSPPQVEIEDQYSNVLGPLDINARINAGNPSNWSLTGHKQNSTDSSGIATFADLGAIYKGSVTNAQIQFYYLNIVANSDFFNIPLITPPTLDSIPNQSLDNPFLCKDLDIPRLIFCLIL